MPIGEGYWVSPDGRVIEIYEHLAYVKEHPDEFGFTPEDLRPLTEEKKRREKTPGRERILKEAMRRGWIRVRRSPSMMPSFETWRVTDETLFRIAEAIRAASLVSAGESLRVTSVRDNFSEVMNAGDLMAGRVFRTNPRGFVVATMTMKTLLNKSDKEYLQGETEGWRRMGYLSYCRRKGRGPWTLLLGNWNWMEQKTMHPVREFKEEAESFAQSIADELDVDVEVVYR